MHSPQTPASTRREARRQHQHKRRRGILVPAALTAAALGMIVATGAIAAPAFANPTATAAAFAQGSMLAVPTVSAEQMQDLRSEAGNALSAGYDAMTDAATLTAEIELSGLDLGAEHMAVETDELFDAIRDLSGINNHPVADLSALTNDLRTEMRSVFARTADLRERLVAAQEQRAAEEAAAQAQREAEAAAAAQRAAEEAAAAAAAANTPEGAKATARAMFANFGWGDDQFSCLESLWNRESGWNYQALNPSSGAFGIPQSLPASKMASAGADWETNAGTQIAWGLGYIADRYGTPCGAWGHSEATNWY